MHEQLFDAEVNKMIEVRAPPPHHRGNTSNITCMVSQAYLLQWPSAQIAHQLSGTHSGAGLHVHCHTRNSTANASASGP